VELLASYVVGSNGNNAVTLTTPRFTPDPGELLVAKMGNEDDDNPVCTGVSGGGLLWQRKVEYLPGTGNVSDAIIYTAQVGGSPEAMSVSSTWSGAQEGTGEHGMIVERWQGAMVLTAPASNGVRAGAGAPSSLIVASQAGSAVTWVDVDWSAAGGTPAARGVDGEIVREYSPGGTYLPPFVSTRATGGSTTDTTVHDVTLPAGYPAGDMLVVFFSNDASAVAALSAASVARNWQIAGTLAQGANARQTIAWKISDGDDAVSFTTADNQQSSYVVLSVANGTVLEMAQTASVDATGTGGGTTQATVTGRTTGIAETAAASHTVALPSSTGTAPTTGSGPALAYGVIGAATAGELTTAKTAGATHGLVEVKWDQCQTAQNGAVDATATLANIQRVRDAGMAVVLRVSLQYLPTFVDTLAVKFSGKTKAGVPSTHNPGNVSGDNARDWVWSASTRALVNDFLNKLFVQIPWTSVERVQLGGGPSGELQYPTSDGTVWWGFSAPAQTGTDLAAGQTVAPTAGYVPNTGTTWDANDTAFVNWYTTSLNNWMLWLIARYRAYYSGPIWVMHPGSGLRKTSQTPTGSFALAYRAQVAMGTDWDAQMAAYPDANVWPYSTWADAVHAWDPDPYSDTNDGNAAPWYHLLRIARARGRAARIWGENTGGQSDADMDRVFTTGSVALGYQGLFWLSHTTLSAGGGAATYSKFTARITTATKAVGAYSRGVSMAGGEFNPTAAPGTYDTDYAYDTATGVGNVIGRGNKLLRVPFRWERVQLTRGGALNTTEVNRILALATAAAAAGGLIMPEMHNYGRRYETAGGVTAPQVDAATPAMVTSSSASTLTTASFTAPAGSLLVACVHSDGTMTHAVGNNGTALTWTLIARQSRASTGTGSAAAFVAPVSTLRSGLTVTWTGSFADDVGFKVYVVTGADLADPVGAQAAGTSTQNVLTTTAITTEKASSLGFIVADEFGTDGTTTSPDLTAFFNYDVVGRIAGGSGYKRLGAAGTGATFTLDMAGTATADWNWVAFEIRGAGTGGATTQLVLGTDLPTADLVDAWTKLAPAFAANPGVGALGLMNEPNGFAGATGSFSGTVRYDWSDGTVQGWTGDTATASNVSGQLRLSGTATAGYWNMRKDDAATKRNNTATGAVLRVKATLGASVTGTWSLIPQWQNASFQWQNPTSTTYTRVDTGATVTGLVAGVAVYVTATFSAITTPNAFAVQVENNTATAGQAVTVDIDDYSQGSASGAQTGAQLWESVSQQLVTAIRTAGVTLPLSVCGYNWAGAHSWRTTHPAPWLTDAQNKIWYEAHVYFDRDHSGDYPNTLAEENAWAATQNAASLASWAEWGIQEFGMWCTANGVRGYIGEVGWPNTGDPTGWNAVGERVYGEMDRHYLGGAYWAAGRRWGDTYNLSIYTGDGQTVVKSPATVVEAHQTVTAAAAAAGEAALVLFANDAASITASTTATGWTSLGTLAQGTTTNHRATVFYAANAATAAALVVALSASATASWAAFRVAGGGAPSIASTSAGAGTAPQSFTPAPLTGLTSGDHTALLLVAVDSSADTGFTQTVTWPSGWANTQTRRPTTASTSSAPDVFTAEQRFLGVTGITPAAASLSVAEQWVAFTVAFRDTTTSGGGGTGPGPATAPPLTVGAADVRARMWVAALTLDCDITVSAGQALTAPGGFGALTRQDGATAGAVMTATAETTSTAPSQAPGAWVYPQTEDWLAATVAITGGTGGGGGAMRMYAGINYDETLPQPAGSRTIGMTAPAGQTWTLLAVELVPAPVTVFLDVVTELEEPQPVLAGRQFTLGSVDELEELPALQVTKLVFGPLLETVNEVEELPGLTGHKLLPPLGVVTDQEEPQPVQVSRLVLLGAPPEELEELPPIRAASTTLFGVVEIEELPPLGVGFGGIDVAKSLPRRGLPPVVYRGGVRLMAQNIVSGRWVHRELPVSGVQLTRTLSGPQVIAATFGNEVGDLRDLLLEPWGTWIHLEEAGEIRASGILMPGAYNPDGSLELEARGPSAYLARLPYTGEFRAVQIDPAEIVRTLWAQAQDFPRGNLGVTVVGSTPVRVGTPESAQVIDADIAANRLAARYILEHWDSPTTTVLFEDLTWPASDGPMPDVVAQRSDALFDLWQPESAEYPDVIDWLRHYYATTSEVVEVKGEPWQLHGYELPLIGKVIDQLGTDTPFDWVEEQGWVDADKNAVWHRIRIGYPRIGNRLDLNLTEGENLLEHAPFEEPDDAYADSVFVQGKGEGADAIGGFAGVDVPTRLRLPRVVTDKTLATGAAATARAHEEVAAALAAVEEIAEIAVNVRHENSLWGTFDVGDEVLPRVRLPWLGTFAQWHRIVQLTYHPDEGYVTAQLSRRDAFRSR